MSMRIRVFLRAALVAAMATASSTAFCATVTWDRGGGTDFWTNALNWNTDSVPTSSDDVIIPNGAGTSRIDLDLTVNSITVQSGVILWIQIGRALTVNDPSTIDLGGSLIVHSSTLSGDGGLTVDGYVEVHGGTLSGNGALIISSSGLLRVFGQPYTPMDISRATTNAGTIEYKDINVPGPKFPFTFRGATLTNLGLIDIQSDHNIDPGLGSPVLNNNSGGVIQKSGSNSVTAINFTVNNAPGGTIEAQIGQLHLNGGGTVSGVYSIDPGAQLQFGPDANTFTMNGNPTVTGDGELRVAGATLDVGIGVDVTIPNLVLASGTITGAGAVRVSGDFDWLGGTIAGSGTRELTSMSLPVISCSTAHCNLDAATLQMNASATFDATTNSLIFANAASLVIASGKTLNITTDGTIVGIGTITNNGTITKSGGTGIRSIGTPLNNNGSVTVTSGGLSFLGNGTHSGSFTTTAPGSILFDGGTHTITGGISGTGIMTIGGGTVTLDSTGNVGGFTMSGGTLGGSGTLTLSNGGTWSGGTMGGSGTTAVPAGKTLTVSGFATLNGRTLDLGAGAMLDLTGQRLDVASATSVSIDGTVHVNGGTLRVLSGVTQTIPKLTLTSGVIDGAGDLHVSGNFNWLGGTIAGSGTRFLTSMSVPTISCSATNCLLDGAELRLQASTTTYSASGNALVFSNGAILNLDDGKTLNVTNDGDFLSGGGAASEIVIGGFAAGFNACIWKTGTAGTSVIGVPVTMSGSFLVETGTLQVDAGVDVAAGAIIDYRPGATIEVTDGVFDFRSSAVSFPFQGDFKISSGTLRVEPDVTVTMPNVTLQGSGVVDGGGTLILSGTSTWSGGTMSGSGTTIVPATETLGISAPVTLDRTLQNDGTVDVGGTITGSGTIDNGGTLNGVEDLTIGVVLDNSGQVVTSNALLLAGDGTHTGTFNVTTPGNLSFSSGTHSLSGAGWIEGTGALSFSGATATVGVPVDVDALSVSAGTATLNADGSAAALFTMTGGTLGGSGTLTLNGGGTWSGGTMSGSGTTINPAAKILSISAPVALSRALQNSGTLSVSGDVTGSGTIANNGTLNVLGNSTIGTALNNSGQIATSELLSLGGDGVHPGTFTVNAPGVIDFSGGTQTISGTLAGTGMLRFSGAAATVSGTWSGMPIEVSGGSAALDTGGTIPALTLSGGTLTGSGDVTVSGPSTWSGGTIAGTGGFTFDTGATVAMPGTNAVTLARPLLNKGTIHYTAAANGMLIDGAAVTNDGTVDIQSSQEIAATPGTPFFANAGTLKKSAGAGVMQFGARLANTGLVQIEAGTMHFSGNYVQSGGTTTVLAEATLQTAKVSLNGGFLTGGGTIAGNVGNKGIVAPGASPGTLTIDGDYVQDPDGQLRIQIGGTASGSYDRLAVSGSVTLDGTLNVSAIDGFAPRTGNAFRILTFGSRANDSTFATMNGLTGSGTTLVPTFGPADLQLIAGPIQADIAASVTAPAAVARGSAFAYTVHVANGGGSDASAVRFTAALPPNVTFTGAVPAVCSGAPSLVCTIGHLSNPSAATVLIHVTAGSSGPAPLTVVATAGEPDPNTANNTATAMPVISSDADLRVAVTGPASTVAGSQAIYTIVVTNDGPDTAGSIAVSASPSAGLTFSANGGACTGTFPCTINALDPGQSATIVSAWTIASSATGSEQLAVDAASPVPDPNPSNNAASAATQIGTCPAILIIAPIELTSGAAAEATATPLGGATYQWSIANGTIDSGNGTAGITFTAGEAGTTTLAVSVSGAGCTLDAVFPVAVKPRLTCVGTATPMAPADGAVTDAVVDFRWDAVDGASGYRLWLQQSNAPAQSLGTTLEPSLTRIIPPGAHQWYVETLFDGCASHESEHRAFTILPGQDCDSHAAPQLSAPANDTPATSAAVAFSWSAVEQALAYELWLAPAGGVPTLIRTTSDTSHTAVVPPGRLEWYVRAVFAGCAATESAHRTFTYTPPPGCSSQRPLLIAPVEKERLTSPVSFEWTGVSGATSYELYVDGVLAATTTSPQASGIPAPRGERRWRVRARLAEGCGAVDSAESRLVVIASPPSCAPLEAPVISAPAQVSSGVPGRLQWSFVAGATAYVVEISGDPRFPRQSTSSNTVTTRRLPFTFTNQGSQPVARYVRVYAVDRDCVQPGTGPFSPVAVLSVLPPASSAGAALLTDPTDVPYTLDIAAELAGRHFTATPTVPWISVAPRSGIVPPGGQTLRAIAHTAGLPPGTNTGRVDITTTEADGPLTQLPTPPLELNHIPGVVTAPKNTPPPDALIIPAVANVTNFIVRYHSDICVTNTSAQVMRYEIDFVPSGPAGLSEGQKTTVSLEPGATMAINDIVATWFGGRSSTGTLEIRPLTEIDTSTSSAPVGGLANRITFASSRTFSTTAAGGTYGQYVPAVPYANFIARGSTLSLQHIAQSDKYRTNLGLVEGSGEKVSVEVRIFDAAGTKRASFHVDLNGGERAQLNGVLQEHGLTLDDGRIEVEVISGDGKVTAYASVVDNATNDPQLVPPVNLDQAGHSKWVVPGVADLVSGSGNWQTDVRIFNAGTETAELTLAFYSMNGGTATTRTIALAAGEVRQLDRVLSFFGISGDAGALHVSSAVPAQIVATARTYRQTGDGAYGQFIAAARPDEAVAVGSRPLQILQMEESERFKSNIGFAEVSGNPVTLEVTVFRPNSNDPAVLEVKLEPNQFRQLSSLLTSLGLGEMYNARISVRAVAGEGRALAYGSLIDHKTGDPTYIPGQ